jgi:hypothetical protein
VAAVVALYLNCDDCLLDETRKVIIIMLRSCT